MLRKRNPPDLKSVAKAKEKANKYVTSDETNKMVKQAILRELNSHLLSVRAQAIHGKPHKEGKEGHKKLAVDTIRGNPYRDQSVRKRSAHGRDEGAKIFAERHGHVSSTISKIPRLAVNIRQPQKQLKAAKSEKPEKYDRAPGYDWDKNGRIAELKIRFIARKHASFWMENVFGRVSPFQARKHYERKLKREAFVNLEDLWWNSRKGWKLNIRAEYHDRCRIWKRCLRGWKIFLMHEKEKKLKARMAERFDERRIMKKCFQSIKEYCELSKARSKEKDKADRFRQFCSDRYVFHHWNEMLSNARVCRSLENQALSFWAVNLKLKALAKWKIAKEVKDVENDKIAIADKHYQALITRRYFAVFMSYISYRRKKQYVKDFATNHFQSNLKKKAINYWYIHLQRRLQIYDLEDRIEFMARKFTLRTYIVLWRSYIEVVHEERRKTAVAVKYCSRNIKIKYFEILRTAASRRRQKIDRLEKAKTFRETKLILVSWNLWLKRCDRSEELKLYPLTKVARKFRRKNILRECLKQWCYYLAWRRKRKVMYAIADAHFERIALPKYFTSLFEYKEIRKVKTERKDIADAFQREFIYAKAFYTWLKHSRISQEVRMLERMAILHNEEVCKRKTLATWRHKTHQVLDRKANEAVADAFRQRCIKVRYLQLLKLNADNETARRKQEVIAFRHDSLKKLSITFNAWLRHTQHTKYNNARKLMADDHYFRKLSLRIFTAFKIYVKERRKVNEAANRRYKAHEGKLMRWTFHRWQEYVVGIVEEKYNFKKADDFRDVKSKKEVFAAWRDVAALLSYERAMENEKLSEIKKGMDKGKLQRAFLSWQECTEKSNRKKQMLCRANQFHENRLKQKFMLAWKEYWTFSYQKQLLQRQCMIYYTQNTLKKFFERWKIQHSGSVQERNRNNVVIWWWSRNLQRKVFYAWRDFIEINKKEKAKILQALEIRRTWLLENCTQKWFQYSTDIMAFRTKIAHSRQIEGTVKLQERVRKYALLWYSKSMKCKKAEWSRNRNAASYTTKDQSERVSGDSISKSSVPMILERKSLAVDLPIICKDHRPMPRKPEYLRDSFDLTLLLANPTDKPFAITDESKPRSQQPEPHTKSRMQSHPSQRSRADNSIEFGLSSEDDLRTKNKLTNKLMRPGEQPKKFDLLPPSSFKKSTPSQEMEKMSSNIRRNTRPQRALSAKEPSSEDIRSDTSSDDVQDENESSDDDDDAIPGNEDVPGSEAIYKEVNRIKEELVQFQNEKIRYRELEEKYQHLSQWIASESREYIENTLQLDEDFQQASQLKLEIQCELEQLSEKLASKKPLVTKMATDIQSLLSKFTAK